jgi:hypothetical protein
MTNIKITVIILLAFVIFSCKTKEILTEPQPDTVPVFCGTFVNTDTSFQLLVGLKLDYWNIAEWTTPFDELIADKPARPASRYFIGGDTLYLEMDKGYLCYKIKDENTLVGIGFWNENEQLIRQEEAPGTCPQRHTLKTDEKVWLEQSRLYYQAYYSTDYATAISILERICEEGYGPACMTLGLNYVVQNKSKGIALLEKACDLGYFGGYACYRLGDVLSEFGKAAAAKTAYQRACDGGHVVGCMVVESELYKKQ